MNLFLALLYLPTVGLTSVLLMCVSFCHEHTLGIYLVCALNIAA